MRPADCFCLLHELIARVESVGLAASPVVQSHQRVLSPPSFISSRSDSAAARHDSIIQGSRDMSSVAGQGLGSSKAANSSNLSSSPAPFQSAPASADSGSQRRPGGSGSFGAGSTSRQVSSAKNNQPRKNQHKRHRRPALVNEDESVSCILYYPCP